MDHTRQKPPIALSHVQPGPCGQTTPGPGLPRRPPVIGQSASVQGNHPALNPPATRDQIQIKSGSAPVTLTNISRPRPTALGTKPAPRPAGIPPKDIDLMPVCIPGPQNANMLSRSPTESSVSPHNPQASLSPKSSLNPPPPASAIQEQSDKTAGDHNDFR